MKGHRRPFSRSRRLTPSESWPALVAVGLVWACGPTPARFATAPPEASTEPHEAHVAFEPPPKLPAASLEGTSSQTLVVLQPPADDRIARDIVRAFFDAVVSESSADLAALFDGRSRFWTGGRSQRESLQAAWSRRLKDLDYTALKGRVIYRESRLEVYGAEQAAKLRLERNLPLVPREDEIVVGAHIVTTTSAGTKLFGDKLVFLLRPHGTGYKIGEIHEDFRLP